MELYLAKGFVIHQHNSKHLSSVHNEDKQRIHAIDIHKSDFVMDFYTEISYVSNTITKFHVQSYLHHGYIHNFFHYKQ